MRRCGRSLLSQAPRRGLCSCAALSPRVKRVWGSRLADLPGYTLPLDGPAAKRWPGDYPLRLCKHAFGIDLGVSAEGFRSAMLESAEACLATRPCGAGDYREWMATGLSNGIAPEFVALAIPPWTSFFVHQHPGIELVYLVRGSMHEIRLESPPHIDRCCRERFATYSLKDPTYRFSRREFRAGGGRWIANEVGSVHQSFTEDEPCLMVAVWPGRYVLFGEEQLPEGTFVPINHDIDREDKGSFKQ